jgi:hypothetical protein
MNDIYKPAKIERVIRWSIVEVVGATSQLELIRGPDTC